MAQLRPPSAARSGARPTNHDCGSAPGSPRTSLRMRVPAGESFGHRPAQTADDPGHDVVDDASPKADVVMHRRMPRVLGECDPGKPFEPSDHLRLRNET